VDLYVGDSEKKWGTGGIVTGETPGTSEAAGSLREDPVNKILPRKAILNRKEGGGDVGRAAKKREEGDRGIRKGNLEAVVTRC